MRFLVNFLVFPFLFSLFCSCSKVAIKHEIDVFVESPSSSSAFGINQGIVMPATGMQAKVVTTPILDIDAFANVDIKFMDYPQLGISSIPGLLFKVKKEHLIKLYQVSGEALSEGKGAKRFFLFVDGQPVGYCRIWNQIRDNNLFFIIDSLSEGKNLEEELKELRFTLNEYILERREFVEKQR